MVDKQHNIVYGICMKIFVFVLCSAALFCGCKLKETILSGQVFIVTQGAENFKLGSVEILLVERSWMTNYLLSERPMIESILAAKQERITNGTYLNCYKTNTDYIKISSDYDVIQIEWNNWKAASDNLNKQADKAQTIADAWKKQCALRPNDETAAAYWSAALDNVTEIIRKMDYTIDQMKLLTDQMQPLIDQMDTIKSNVTTAAFVELKDHPTPEDYFTDFTPVVAQKTITDSDGKFYFSYPSTIHYTIFASAQRKVLNNTETYYWIVDAPTDPKTAQILLNNRNLIFVDPDNYFTVKPVEAPQKLVGQQ